MRFFAAALFFFGAAVSYSQSPEVPHKLQFAGMTLTIREDARREIQKDVDALTQHPYYFNIKVERAKTYFPIIEKIFREERLPDDFKYLAIQESALISDAVSVSDAVGFWQFKDFTAEEMGMRVDKEIDERMNLVSATRGAAKYLKQNNYYFNNWVYALQAYQMGAGGAMRAVGDKHNGAKHMDIDKHTYWYVKKYLAHKIAFENALKGDSQLKLSSVEVDSKTTIEEIAERFSVSEETVSEYNKWAKRGVIPGDKKYTVFIPEGSYDQNFTKLAIASSDKPSVVSTTVAPAATTVFINQVPAIVAKPGDQLTTLADRAGIGLTALLRYNEISIDHKVIPGHSYFTDKKKKKASEPYHKVLEGENLWAISQSYGIQLKKLKKYNRITANQSVSPNAMLWLAGMKPPKEETLSSEVIELDAGDEFTWGQVSMAKSPVRSVGVGSSNAESVDMGDNTDERLRISGSESDDVMSPSTDDVGGETIIHEVQASDTLYSVSRQYGVTIKQLMEWNGKQDFGVSVGEKLRILTP